jgi:hypothetical protein
MSAQSLTANSVNSIQGSNDVGGWTNNSVQNIRFKYEPLDDIITKESFRYTSIPLPDFEKATTVSAYNGNYNAKNEKNAVTFAIEGRPLDSKDGKELIKKSFERVKEVLKKDYKPATATITTENGKGGETGVKHVDDCILTGVDMVIDQQQGEIILRFIFQGLLKRSDS